MNPEGSAADWPSGFVTVTFTEPELCAGVVAWRVVELLTVTELAARPPKVTDIPVWKLLPLIVTVVPPSAGPDIGDTLLTEKVVDP